jgi:hypothetical protein
MEGKGVGKRRTQLHDDLRKRRIYLELKEEAEDRNRRLSIFHKSLTWAYRICAVFCKVWEKE